METGPEEKDLEKLKEIEEKERENKQEEIVLAELLLEKEKEDQKLDEEKEEIEHRIREHHEHGHREIMLTFVVNSSKATFPVREDELLKTAVEKALKETGNEGRKPDEWTVKYDGRALDINKTIHELGLPDHAVIMLSLNAGGGGAK